MHLSSAPGFIGRSFVLGCVLQLSLAGCGDDGSSSGGSPSSGGGGAGGEPSTGGAPLGGAASGGAGGEATGGAASGGASSGGMGGEGGAGDPCAACPDSCCDGACVDFASDGEHCGSCAHSCEGGGCQDASCQPALIASGKLIGIDEDEVFISGAMVSRFPKAGGAGTPIGSLPGGPSSGDQYYLAAADIYRTYGGNNGGVDRLEIATGTSTTIATAENNPTYPVEVGTNVYWGTTGGIIRRANKSGGAATNFISNQGIPYELKTDGTTIYFSDTLLQKVKRVSLNGTFGVTTDVPSARRLALSGNFIYLTGQNLVYYQEVNGFNSISAAIAPLNGSEILSLAVEGGGVVVGTAEGLRSDGNLIVAGGPIPELFSDAERIYFEQNGSTYKLVR